MVRREPRYIEDRPPNGYCPWFVDWSVGGPGSICRADIRGMGVVYLGAHYVVPSYLCAYLAILLAIFLTRWDSRVIYCDPLAKLTTQPRLSTLSKESHFRVTAATEHQEEAGLRALA